jgi:hypothetical protein
MKINYFGVVAAVLAFASLVLSWYTVTMTAVGASIKMDFTVYLYQIQGTVNGVSATAFPNIWFVWGALALMVITAVGCLAGSVLAGRKGQLLLLMAGILALLAMVAFGGGLLNSNYANEDLEPASAMGLFPANAFGITVDNAMQYGYNFVWSLSYGFWLAAVAPSLLAKKSAVPANEPKTV